ncbi:MAG: O-antigen ligase family protein [Paraglaciecola sp.]|nr:O-antigen ligase family protein [Paraglaciecola sp.]
MINAEQRWWYFQIPDFRYSFFASILMLFALAKNYSTLSNITRWRDLPVLKWILVFLFLHYVGYAFALNIILHREFTYNFLKLVIIFMVAYKIVNSEKMLDAALWVYVLGCTYIGTVAKDVGRNGQGRVEGIGMVDTGGDANGVAAVLVPSIVVLLYFAWQGSWKIRLLAAFCSAYVVNALVLINSRGAFLGVVVGAGLFIGYMLFSRFQKPGQRGMAIFIVLAGLAGAVSLADATFWERMQTLQADEQGQRGGDGRGRIDYWLSTLDMINDYPMGMGIGGFSALSTVYLGEYKAVHSTWFQVLGEFSWYGLLIFIAILVSTLRLSQLAKKYLIKNNNIAAYFKLLMLECSLFGFLIASTFIDRARAEVLFWLILFISIACNVYYFQPRRKIASEKIKNDI